MDTYRILFETVLQGRLKDFSSADPLYYRGTRQVVPNSGIPDDAWYEVINETSDPWDQYRTLRSWDDEGINFVRNVRLERLAAEPA